jgi:hypothetical protein
MWLGLPHGEVKVVLQCIVKDSYIVVSQEWAVLSDLRLYRAWTAEAFRSKKIRALFLRIS